MKTTARILAAAAALFALAVLVFHGPREDEAARPDRLEIYYMYNEGESQQKWFARSADEFKELWRERHGRELQIDIVYAGREVLAKLRPRLLTGNPPDLVNQGGDLMEPLMKEGLMEPLTAALQTPSWTGESSWQETFLPGTLDIESYKGEYYMIPVGVWCTVFFYDVSLFERLGLEAPATWGEFLEVCSVLKANGIEPIAADGTEPSYNAWYYAALLMRLTTVERIMGTARNEPGTSWTDEPFLKAATMLRELRDNGYIMRGYEGSKWPSAQMQWAQGKCGLLYCGTWIPKEMKESLPEGFRIGIFRFPTIEGREDADALAQDIGVEAFMIPRGARNRETAVEFLKFITSREKAREQVALDTATATAGVGMPESLAGLETLLAPPHRLINGTAGITSEMPEWYRTVARDSWSEFFLGRYGPDEFCRTLDAAHGRYHAQIEALGKEPR